MMRQMNFVMFWLCALNMDIVTSTLYDDFVRGELKLRCTLAIDFSESVGDGQNRRSAHLTSSDLQKDFELALSSVANIFQAYNSDASLVFSVLGFGATTSATKSDEHSTSDVFCVRERHASDAARAYADCVREIHTPVAANFAPVIRNMIKIARDSDAESKNYFVLTILTNGKIADLDETIEAIVEASYQPISIVIVGVGKHDFHAINSLDGDDELLVANGKKAQRDIVQIVHFDYGKKERLAEEVMVELPRQIHDFKPTPPALR